MLSNTERSTIRKGAHKAAEQPSVLYRIIDESMVAHVAFSSAQQPMVIPMLAWRVDNKVYIHGAKNSRLLKSLKLGAPCTLCFTLFDGWVLARSAFHHSAHYRSAVVFGSFEVVDDNSEKDRLLQHFVEQIAPGRNQHIRQGNQRELNATELLAMELNEASVKISDQGVNDDLADLDRPVWAGVLPYRTVVGPLEPVPELADALEQPDYSSAYPGRWHAKPGN